MDPEHIADIPPPTLSQEILTNEPKHFYTVSHSIMADSCEGGLQCVVILDASKPFSSILGLPSHKETANLTCFLQVTPKYQAFWPHNDAQDKLKLVLTLEEYLNLYRFFACRWPVVCSKIVATSEGMLQPDLWIQFSDHLHFMDPGMARYSVTLGKDLVFSAECTPSESSQHNLKAFLSKKEKSIELPLTTCVKLFASTRDYFFLQEKMHQRPLAVSPKDGPSKVSESSQSSSKKRRQH